MFRDNMRVVFDTSVIISQLICPGSIPYQAYMLAEERASVLFSEVTLSELAEVLQRPKFARYIRQEKIEKLLQNITQGAELISVTTAIRACRDPKDDMFLELAVSGGAQYIVTGDDDLLLLHPFQGIHILTPRDFIEYVNKIKT